MKLLITGSGKVNKIIQVEKICDKLSEATGLLEEQLFSSKILIKNIVVGMRKTVGWSGKRYGKSYALERHYRYGLLSKLSNLSSGNNRRRAMLKAFKVLYGR